MPDYIKLKIGRANTISQLGKKLSEEHKKKIAATSIFQNGENNPSWKGDNAKYIAKHNWIKRVKGKPIKCELCGTTEKRKYHWASKNHKYTRDPNEYMSVCVSCHRKWDIKYNNYRIGYKHSEATKKKIGIGNKNNRTGIINGMKTRIKKGENLHDKKN